MVFTEQSYIAEYFDVGAPIRIAGYWWYIRSITSHAIPGGVRADVEVVRPKVYAGPFWRSLTCNQRHLLEMEEAVCHEFAICIGCEEYSRQRTDHAFIKLRVRTCVTQWLYIHRTCRRSTTLDDPIEIFDPPRYRPPAI